MLDLAYTYNGGEMSLRRNYENPHIRSSKKINFCFPKILPVVHVNSTLILAATLAPSPNSILVLRYYFGLSPQPIILCHS